MLIPELGKEFPNLSASIDLLSEQAQNTEMLLDDFVKKTYGNVFNNSMLDTSDIINNAALFKHVIAKILRENFKMYVNSGMLEDMFLKAKNSQNNSQVYENDFLVISKAVRDNTEYLKFSVGAKLINYAYTLNLGESMLIPEINKIIELSKVSYNDFVNSDKQTLFFACPQNAAFTIRNFTQGDKIKLKFGTKKISDLFCDNKIPREDRAMIPLIEFNSKIIAVFAAPANNNYVAAENLVDKNSACIVAVRIV